MAMPVSSISALQTWSRRCAVAMLLVCVAMTTMAGWMLGGENVAFKLLFAFGFGVVTIGAAVLMSFIGPAWQVSAGLGAALTLAWCVFTASEFVGHVMVFASQRHASIQKASVQNVRFEGAKTATDEDEAAYRMWTERYTNMKQANPWAATTTAEALQAEVANIEGDALFKRSRQCADVTKPDSRAFCDRLTATRKQLASIVELNKAADQMAATKRKLDEARNKVATTDKGFSEAAAQVDVVSIMTSLSLRPSDDHKQASNIGLELFIALLFTIGPMTLLKVSLTDFSAKRDRKPGLIAWVASRLGKTTPPETVEAPVTPEAPPALAPASGVTTYHVEVDEHGRRNAEEAHAIAKRLEAEARAKADADARRRARIAAVMQSHGLKLAAA